MCWQRLSREKFKPARWAFPADRVRYYRPITQTSLARINRQHLQMNGSTKAVFLSYASQDAAAAMRVCEALRAGGIEVWFDQSELRGGDAWDASIRMKIKECALFVPLISATTDARGEGYFRLEWKLAVDRTHLMADDKAFLLPVVIDATLDAKARVPDKFREVQWTHLPAGAATATFVAQVSRLLSSDDPKAPGAANVPSSATPMAGAASSHRQRSWRSRPVMLVLAAAAVLAIGSWVVDRMVLSKRLAAVEATTSVPAGSLVPGALLEKSVAVLPLVNLSGDEKDNYLGDGISGEILSALSKLPGLKVIGRASSFQFRDRDVDAVKVGRALNVRSLLTGTVQRAGDNLRISVELIDTTSGMQSWSQHFDRGFGNLFALEDDISSAVSTALAVKLGSAAGQPLVNVATTNAHAHDLYLRARELSYRSDEASLNQAVALFNKAIAEDPGYAEAWAGLAWCYLFLADGYRAPIDLLPVTKGAAEKAVALDPGLAEAHANLAYILVAYQRDFPAAEREIDKAVSLNPRSADVQFFLGTNRLLTRQAAAARTAYQIAEKLDPLNPWIPFGEVWTDTALNDYPAALQNARRILKIDPGFSYFTDPLVYVYGSFGRWQDCINRSTATQGATAGEPDYKAAVCYAHLGQTERARGILKQLETTARTRYVDHVNIAEIYAALGDKDAAFKALEHAFEDRSQPLLNAWFVPEFEPLHDDPRYRKLMDRIYAGLTPRTTP
jgi:TolB-like protein/tetratricopeptide (TPR) repeat protein